MSGAKAEIQALVSELAGRGISVVLISSDLEEVVEESDALVDPARRCGRRLVAAVTKSAPSVWSSSSRPRPRHSRPHPIGATRAR